MGEMSVCVRDHSSLASDGSDVRPGDVPMEEEEGNSSASDEDEESDEEDLEAEAIAIVDPAPRMSLRSGADGAE